MLEPLPLATPAAVPQERSDARRNRQLILCAAARLIERDGLDCVSMDDVAAEAGVGKGTLYRRFGDRATLLRALVDEEESAFQEQIIRGAPPLGPGAPPLERLRAVGLGLLSFYERHAAFIAAADTGGAGARFRHPVYVFYRTHIGVLLRQHFPPERHELVDPLADALLAALSAELFLHQRRGQGMSAEVQARGWEALVDAIGALAG